MLFKGLLIVDYPWSVSIGTLFAHGTEEELITLRWATLLVNRAHGERG